jgi:hypothetical protein
LGERLESLFQLVSKLVKVRGELLSLVILAFAPVINLVNKWLENLVNDGVQGIYGVFANLSKKDSAISRV